jgi:hypothetical protein
MRTNPYPAERQTRNEGASIAPRAVMQSLLAKQQIINELIAGRLELLEAAARFQAAHRTTAACLVVVAAAPGDGESLCRTVIGWVHLALSGRPEEAERVSERLERELQGHLERQGQLSLPPR